MIDLTGKTALVCGSTQGIGRACAELFARLGANVTLLARNAEALRQSAAALQATTAATIEHICADFRDPTNVSEEVREYLAESGKVFHILVNNTGGPPGGPAIDATAHDFLNAVQMHLLCNHLLVQAVVPGMKQVRYGRIVNIVSTSVREPIPGLGVSNTIRAAVAGWAKTLSRELGPHNITVNNILPGFTATARLESLVRERAQKESRSPEEVEHAMRAAIPLGRFAQPEEIAAAVAFLVSPAGSYVSGVSLPVDGGRLASI